LAIATLTGRDYNGQGLYEIVQCIMQSLAHPKDPRCIIEKVLPALVACKGTGDLGGGLGGYLLGPGGAVGGYVLGCAFGGYVASEANEDPSDPGAPPSFPWPF